MVTLALALVTLTPSCLARAMMSMRLREETALAILLKSQVSYGAHSTRWKTRGKIIVLGSIGAVVHHQELKVLDVVDKERLVARGHHVAGLLVGAIADLGHVLAATEATTDAVVNTLGFSPARVEALEAIGLVAEEASSACLELVGSCFMVII